MFIGDWEWLDASNVPGLLDWIAFVVGGAGIGFTIYQLVRSKSALKAAKEALDSTRASLIRNQVVAILPGFQQISLDVDASVRGNDRDAAETALQLFCVRGVESATLLKDSHPQFVELADELEAAAEFAAAAQSGLYEQPQKTVQDIIGEAASEIRRITLKVVGLAASLRNDLGKASNA